jgi:beta-glucosidase
MAASFNVSNAFISGYVTGVEFRSDHMDYTEGLTCYGPMTNIMRSPLWGRNHEGYGEDPFLSSQMVCVTLLPVNPLLHHVLRCSL